MMQSQTPPDIQSARRITWIGLWVNLVLVGLKLIGGIFGFSQVLIADAIHSLSDLITDAAVLLGSQFWGAPADEEHPHGHAKIETLVTLFIGVLLAIVGLELIQGAVQEIRSMLAGTSERETPTFLAFIVALLSIVIKEILYWATVRVGRRARSPSVVANAWHHRSDALSSIPAAVSVGFCLLLGPHYLFLDPVGTIVVACMVIYAAWEIIKPTLATLLDRSAPQDHIGRIRQIVYSCEDVRNVHKIRTRYLSAETIAVDLHIQVDPEMTVRRSHALSHFVARRLLEEGPLVVDVVIHIEPYEGIPDETGY
ncbi:MAG: cation diffusion facilitator family transporter [Thermoguttaceae bacterium]